MLEIMNFLKPGSAINIWTMKHGALIISCFFIYWIFSMILSRVELFEKKDIQLKVYFGCMMPLLIYTLLGSALLLFSAFHYKQTGMSLGYSIPYLGATIITWALGWQLAGKIDKRLREIGRRERK